MWPSFLSILAKSAGETFQGSVQSFASSSGSGANTMSLIMGGIFYGIFDVATFLVSAGVILIVFSYRPGLNHCTGNTKPMNTKVGEQ